MVQDQEPYIAKRKADASCLTGGAAGSIGDSHGAEATSDSFALGTAGGLWHFCGLRPHKSGFSGLSGTRDVLKELAWAHAKGATQGVQRVPVHSLDLPSRLRDSVDQRVSEPRLLN